MAEYFAREKQQLRAVSSPFDGYKERPARVSSTALVSYDRHRYSVTTSEAGRAVMVRAYADRIVVVHDGKAIGQHRRQFDRDKIIYDAWHYIEVKHRPGALSNGAPFKEWVEKEIAQKNIQLNKEQNDTEIKRTRSINQATTPMITRVMVLHNLRLRLGLHEYCSFNSLIEFKRRVED